MRFNVCFRTLKKIYMPFGYPCQDLDEHMVSNLKSFSREACRKAIEILKERLEQIESSDQYLSIEVWELPLSIRSANALISERLHTVKDVLLFGLDRIHFIRNIGPKAEKEIRDVFGVILQKKNDLNGLSQEQLKKTLIDL